MRRIELKKLKKALEEVDKYEKETNQKVGDNPAKTTEIMIRSIYMDASTSGLQFTPTVGGDEDYTLESPGDLRPVVFSLLSKRDSLLYHCSALFTTSEAVVRKRLQMNPFPVAPEEWMEMQKGDVLDAMILTTFDFDGEPHSFHTIYAGIQKVTLLITNLLDPKRGEFWKEYSGETD